MNKADLNPAYIAFFYILRCLVPLAIMLGISYSVTPPGTDQGAYPTHPKIGMGTITIPRREAWLMDRRWPRIILPIWVAALLIAAGVVSERLSARQGRPAATGNRSLLFELPQQPRPEHDSAQR